MQSTHFLMDQKTRKVHFHGDKDLMQVIQGNRPDLIVMHNLGGYSFEVRYSDGRITNPMTLERAWVASGSVFCLPETPAPTHILVDEATNEVVAAGDYRFLCKSADRDYRLFVTSMPDGDVFEVRGSTWIYKGTYQNCRLNQDANPGTRIYLNRPAPAPSTLLGRKAPDATYSDLPVEELVQEAIAKALTTMTDSKTNVASAAVPLPINTNLIVPGARVLAYKSKGSSDLVEFSVREVSNGRCLIGKEWLAFNYVVDVLPARPSRLWKITKWTLKATLKTAVIGGLIAAGAAISQLGLIPKILAGLVR